MNTSPARVCTIVLSILVLCACGGGGASNGGGTRSGGGDGDSSSDDDQASTETGVFLDSAVQGLRYETDSQSGMTNADGEFEYIEGENVVFSIGDLEFRAVPGQAQISPYNLAGTIDTTDTELVNITRLLQTLDTDADPSNGITISDAAHMAATALDFSSPTFDTDVTNLIANSGTNNMTLIDSVDAIAHLTSNVTLGGNCASTHPSVGYTTELSTLAHAVGGTATIIDNCTIAISGFSYDGGGLPDVRVYAGTGGDYAGGFSISGNIYGQSYDDDLFIIDLGGTSLDSFGQGTFSPP